VLLVVLGAKLIGDAVFTWLPGYERATPRAAAGSPAANAPQADGARVQAGEPQLVSYLSARWTLSSTASRQDVPGEKSNDDDRRRDRDDGDGGGGYDHAAILASCPASKPGGERRTTR
jgi:hypothetical protein